MPIPIISALFSNIGWSLFLVGSSDLACQRIEYNFAQERKVTQRRRRRRRGGSAAGGAGAGDGTDDDSSDGDGEEVQHKQQLVAQPFVPDLSRSVRLMLSFGPVTDTLIFFQYQFGNPYVCPIGIPWRSVKLALFDNFVFWPVLCILSVGISSITQDDVPASQRFKADYCPVYWSGALMYFPPQVLIFQCVSQSYQMAALKAITFCYGVSASFLTNRRLESQDELGKEFDAGMSTPRSSGGKGYDMTPYVSPRTADLDTSGAVDADDSDGPCRADRSTPSPADP